jgi:hypothetical protein
MRTSSLLLLTPLILLAGCNLHLHLHERAVRAPPEESSTVRFPDSFEQATRLDGPAFRAMEIAMDEFLPLGTTIDGGFEAMTRCLSRRDTYDVSILKAEAALYFVRISPNLDRCGLGEHITLDGDALYAIDGSGRIVAKE